jgi:hypothetical protein
MVAPMSALVREIHVVEERWAGQWQPRCGLRERIDAVRIVEMKDEPSDYRVQRYVPDEETGDAFALIVAAGCQGGVFTEGGSWVCRLTNEHGDSSSGYGPLAPAGEKQHGAKVAVEMAIKKFPRGVR